MIKAIDTEYNGYKFRSRLEARWAVFFDAVGLKYEYEKEGFDLDGIYYLPDFWLPELKTWIEIKGDIPSKEERKKCSLLAGKIKNRVYLLHGDIPYIPIKNEKEKNNYGIVYDDFWDLMYDRNWVMFFDEGEDYPYVFCECFNCGKIGIEFDGRSDRICEKCPPSSPNMDKGYNCYSKKIRNGYKKARSYRFQRGE